MINTSNLPNIDFNPEFIHTLTIDQQQMLCEILEKEELKILQKLTKYKIIKLYIDVKLKS